MAETKSKEPVPDPAEYNAFFPSEYSLSQFTSAKSDLADADYSNPAKGGKKFLVIMSEERYVMMENGKLFSTGNHPVEALVPMYHLHQAGFECDIATLGGEMVKFEYWAMPKEDETITGFFNSYLPKFRKPLKLSDIKLDASTEYAGVFIPGGHGALVSIPESADVADALRWAAKNDRYTVVICHGPAAFLSLKDDNPYKGYKMVAFPDSLDRQIPSIGYLPGTIPFDFGKELTALGFTVLNSDIKGAVHQDRKLFSGDSPLAANNLGKAIAAELLKAHS